MTTKSAGRFEPLECLVAEAAAAERVLVGEDDDRLVALRRFGAERVRGAWLPRETRAGAPAGACAARSTRLRPRRLRRRRRSAPGSRTASSALPTPYAPERSLAERARTRADARATAPGRRERSSRRPRGCRGRPRNRRRCPRRARGADRSPWRRRGCARASRRGTRSARAVVADRRRRHRPRRAPIDASAGTGARGPAAARRERSPRVASAGGRSRRRARAASRRRPTRSRCLRPPRAAPAAFSTSAARITSRGSPKLRALVARRRGATSSVSASEHVRRQPRGRRDRAAARARDGTRWRRARGMCSGRSQTPAHFVIGLTIASASSSSDASPITTSGVCATNDRAIAGMRTRDGGHERRRRNERLPRPHACAACAAVCASRTSMTRTPFERRQLRGARTPCRPRALRSRAQRARRPETRATARPYTLPGGSRPRVPRHRRARCRPAAARRPRSLLRRGGDRLLIDCAEGTQRQLLRSSVGLRRPARGLPHALPRRPLPRAARDAEDVRAARPRAADCTIYGPPGLTRSVRGAPARSSGELTYRLRARRARSRATCSTATATGIVTFTGRRTACAALGYALVEEPRPGRFDVETGRRARRAAGAGARRAAARRGGRRSTTARS